MNNHIPLITCTRCLMDTSDDDIYFNDEGVCNHCLKYAENLNKRTINSKDALNKLVANIKKSNSNGKYDCVIGISGGIDSSYVAYYVKTVLKLNPLAVHLDNGWNTSLAIRNVKKIIEGLDIDLYTRVLDWESFRKVQLSFLMSNLPDIEIPTDHFINAQLYETARKLGIKYVINGMNFSTESIAVPSWSYGHSDWKYIKSVYEKYHNEKLDTSLFPKFSLFDLFKTFYFHKVKVVSILNYIDFNKNEALKKLIDDFNYIPYSGKHNESFVTKFLQDYILPNKFGYDKRKIHLSDLIYSKTISREEAKKILDKKINVPEADILFFCKKMGITTDEFNSIIFNDIRSSFKQFPNSSGLVFSLKKIYNILRGLGVVSR